MLFVVLVKIMCVLFLVVWCRWIVFFVVFWFIYFVLWFVCIVRCCVLLVVCLRMFCMFKLELFVKFWKELRKLSFEFVEFREDLRFDELFDKKELVVGFWFKEVFIEVLCLFVLVGWNFCSCLDFLGVLL